MTRGEYGERVGISVGMLDYYRRRWRERSGGRDGHLIEVELAAEVREGECGQSGFAVVLSNGRRIESGWRYSEQELAKLVRLIEAV